jgi:hypothetical protein
VDHIAVFHKGIATAISRFQGNPFDFLYERDLQALVFSLLLSEFADERIPMAGGFHGTHAYGGSDTVQTVPVKCEYPNPGVFDIAIIDRHAVRLFDRELWQRQGMTNDAFWNQPVRAAAELKYCQLGDRETGRLAEVRKDEEKLHRYLEERRGKGRPFLGISMLFIQSAGPIPPAFLKAHKLQEDLSEGIARYLVSPQDWQRFRV